MTKPGNTLPVNIEDAMKRSYMDYAMSVIVGRALPDVRDGLKPVHRRVLFAMRELGNTYNKPYKKSARVVGDVIGKYHPHGDAAVYETIVRLTQDFSLRHPVVDGQGNFGSIDGDSAAAMRYTEVRLAKLADEMLGDLEKETVDFVPNYDESLEEPALLPSKLPFLLVNGSAGIAVGMTTNIPPHNLGEIAEALIYQVDNPNCSVADLMQFVKGPDFPTGGYILGTKAITQAYETGRGLLRVQAKTEIETTGKGDRERIVVTEIPYQVNKAKLVEKIAELVRDKRVIGISDIRDESNRLGMRVVVDIKKDAVAKVVLNQLLKHTQLQESFGVIMLALVDNQPRLLNLKELLGHFLRHRRVVITRRTLYDLRKAKEREHILEGLKTALDNIDGVVALIRAAKDPADALEGLKTKFGLSDVQGKAILEMRLQRLTGLERQKILDELDEVRKLIDRLVFIRDNEDEKSRIIKTELAELKTNFADSRRTIIETVHEDMTDEDLIAEEDVVVTLSHTGYIKRIEATAYRSQRRGGKGVKGMETREEDFVDELFIASTHDYIMFFTTTGRVYVLKTYELPPASRTAMGKPITAILPLQPDEKIASMFPVREFPDDSYLVIATQKGIINKTSLGAFAKVRTTGINAITLDDGDSVISARITDGKKNILLATRDGMSIQFAETDARAIGRGGKGVKGIDLRGDDIVVGMAVTDTDPGSATLVTVTENGYGKRTLVSEYRPQKRGGFGLIDIKTSDRNGKVIGIRLVEDADDIIIATEAGLVIRMNAGGISVIGRNTQGVRIVNLEDSDRVSGVAQIEARMDDGENGSNVDGDQADAATVGSDDAQDAQTEPDPVVN